MTKKAEKAASVEANKKAAYVKKVRSLVGHVAERLEVEATLAALASGISAEAYAAAIASREPVGAVIHPLKEQAVESAEKNCRKSIEKIRADLEAAGWDIDKVAPRPKSFGPGAVSHDEYKAMQRRRWRYEGVTRNVKENPGAYDATNIVKIDDASVERRVNQWREIAAGQYDAFICKMVGKIGACDAATIEGSHVWGWSILTVKKGDVVERWKTQQIENVSKLNLYFPQWPSRLIKGGA